MESDKMAINDGKKSKRDIVKKLLNSELTDQDDEELLDLLIDQPISIDIDKQEDKNMTQGDRVADKISEIAGSWGFIFGFIAFLIIWMCLNIFGIIKIDEYPFILLNLLLSCLAALQAPIIMMSQNREAKRERLKSTNDFKTNIKSELILEKLYDKIDVLIRNQDEIINYINSRDGANLVVNKAVNNDDKEEDNSN